MFGGVSRKLEHETVQRYRVHLKQTLIARGPQIQTVPRVTELRMTVEERAFAPEGADPYVTVTVVDASATGPDAEIEKSAALGKGFKVTYSGDEMSFDFGGKQIGKVGELRMVDLALINHLLDPVGQPRGLSLNKDAKGQARSDSATLPPGWSADDLALTGSSSVVNEDPYRGHRAATVSNTHSGTAHMDLAIFDDANPATEKFDPVANGFFSSLFRSDPAISASPLKNLFLAPLAVVDLFTFVFGCIFTLGFFPGCEEDTQQDGHVTVDMSGPFSSEATATVHRRSGVSITSSGKGTLKLDGSLPQPPPPAPGTPQARSARSAGGLAGAALGLEVSWEMTRTLEGEIPDDGLWWLPFVAAILGAAAVVAIIAGTIVKRRNRRAAGIV